TDRSRPQSPTPKIVGRGGPKHPRYRAVGGPSRGRCARIRRIDAPSRRHRGSMARFLKLERMDIHGFKSFYARTRFEFPEGITAVVGPNGCGKSNVGDA